MDEQVRVELTAIRERLDDSRELSAQRHTENVQRLVRIEDEVRTTNGRVTRNEEQIRTLFRDDDAHKKVGSKDDGNLKLADLKWYLACAGGGAGTVLWILKLMGKI